MACQIESSDVEFFTIVWWNTAGAQVAIRNSMSSSIVLLFAASGPVKHLNGLFLVPFPHVASGRKNGVNISSWESVQIILFFQVSNVFCDSFADKVYCICAWMPLFQFTIKLSVIFAPLSL